MITQTDSPWFFRGLSVPPESHQFVCNFFFFLYLLLLLDHKSNLFTALIRSKGKKKRGQGEEEEG